MPGHGDTVLSLSGMSPERMVGPSFRLIVDLADWDRSVATQTPGQSGSPDSTHFNDLAASWAAGEYFPLSFTPDAVRAHGKSTLTLTPPEGER
jgi:penicillin amidase